MNYTTFENCVSNAVLSYTKDPVVTEKKLGEAICTALYRVLACFDGKYAIDKRIRDGFKQPLVPGSIIRKRATVDPSSDKFFPSDDGSKIYTFDEVAAPKRYVTNRNWVILNKEFKQKTGEDHSMVRTHFINGLIPFNLLKNVDLENEFKFVGFMDLNLQVLEVLTEQFNTLSAVYTIETVPEGTKPHEITEGILDLSQTFLVKVANISRNVIYKMNISEA